MLETGQQIAQFKIISKLGEGGMGEVYLAEDQKLTRKVAFKILRSDFFDDSDRLERFKREAKTAAKISHSNVMSIYDIGLAVDEKSKRELNYIVMEYIEGVSLTDYLGKPNLEISDLLRISEKIARGLAEAHKLNIVHRDIKTDNIIIGSDGEPKILDFGLAKPLEPVINGDDKTGTASISANLTQEGKILGTISFMSPEQARGEPVDTRSDIFSFGNLLYKIFTGEYPFQAPDQVSIIAKILESKPIPPRKKNETIPPELERIIDKCLQKNRNDRYQDTRDLAVDLRSLRRQYESGISDSDSLVLDVASKRKKTSFLSFGTWKIPATILALLLISVILVKFLSQSDSDRPGTLQARENALAILGFENKTGDSEFDWLEAGLPEILLTDLAQGGTGNIISRSRILDYCEEKSGNDDTPPSHKEYMDAARMLGATTALSGSFFKLGDRIRIDARLEDIETGKIILGEKVVGNDPFILVDSLTQKIAQSLDMKNILSNNIKVASITSSSPDAYKHYIMGMEKFNLNLFDEAIKKFKRAIELDSTFALPYLRIGMAHTFNGRLQLGLPYFTSAMQFEKNLPLKEKNLLDIYADTWLRKNYDDAFTKLKTFVGNYPDDKEARGIFALFLSQIANQPEAACAQLDTVLMLDPKFLFALQWYAQVKSGLSEYEEAIKYAKLTKKYYPQSPTGYEALAHNYRRLKKYDDAIRECKELLEIDPGNSKALTILYHIYLRIFDFKNAASYVGMIKDYYYDDPYEMSGYFAYIANLANWEGKFKTSLDYRFKGLEQTLKSGDSAYISGAYYSIATTYSNLYMSDSALFYGKKGFDWSTQFQTLQYPFIIVTEDSTMVEYARKLFKESLQIFRSNVPTEMWEMADILEEVFNALADNDTTAIITTYEKMIDNSNMKSSGETYNLSKFLILTNQYKKGLEVMQSVCFGDRATTSGFTYLRAKYYIGVANEGLGNTREAVENYREVLKYWDNPEIEIKEIKDTKERLAGLTS